MTGVQTCALPISIITDILHIVFILAGLALVVPWVAKIAGVQGIAGGLAGTKGSANIFDPHIAFSFGIVTSIGLLAGSVVDQQFWQRCFAVKEDRLVPAFLIGGLIFAVVPVALSVLGFVAANSAFHIAPPVGTGLPMIGIAAIAHLLPSWVLFVFVVMLLSGLTSSLDSGLIAGASLYAIDMRRDAAGHKETLRKERMGLPLNREEDEMRAAHERDSVRQARRGMLGFALIGLLTAFIVWQIFPLDRLWWLFNGVGTMFVVPTVLSIFWDRLSARGVIQIGRASCRERV